jgi:hypothetical protein
VLAVVSWLPTTGLIALYAFTLVASLELGHFPVPSTNDPKYLHCNVMYHSVWLLFLLNIVIVPFHVFLVAQCYFRKLPILRSVAIYLLGWGLGILQLLADPFQMVYWYLD